MATISTHNGSSAHREHNIRNPKVIEKEDGHIKENGHFEVWKDEKVKDAYHRLFDESQNKYNENQKRDDRKVDDYYTQVKNSKTQHTCYEMIAGVYDDETPTSTKRTILKEFVENWQYVNPNLEMIGAYYHDDEASPHVHIDYIPVAHNYTRGLDTQAGLVKAFEEMGFVKNGKETAQIKWERYMNQQLENLCEMHGIKVERPTSKEKHLETKIFKLQKEVELLELRRDNTIRLFSQIETYKGKFNDLPMDKKTPFIREITKGLNKADFTLKSGNYEEAQSIFDSIKNDCDIDLD